jgi:hypothetical protein
MLAAKIARELTFPSGTENGAQDRRSGTKAQWKHSNLYLP